MKLFLFITLVVSALVMLCLSVKQTNYKKLWRLAKQRAGDAVALSRAQYPGCEGAMASTTTDIFSKCIPAIRTNIAQCGLMTICDAAVPTPSELDDIFKDGSDYRVMEALFHHQMEMKFCQVKQYSLFDYFMANKVNLSHKLNVDPIRTGLARIRPYILVERKAPIRNNYWTVTGGLACDLDGTPNGGGAYWRIDVTSNTGIPANAGWFNAKERVYIDGQTSGGTSTKTAWEVKNSALTGGFVRVVLGSQNTNSFLDSARLESPVTGLLVRGTANISDFESFCARPPGLLTNNTDEFWIETTRDSQCIDELYEEWRNLILANNPLYREYNDLSPIEYNKQSGEDFQRRWVNTVFFNKALANQTLEDVGSLEDINTVEPGGARCVGKRANAIGIYEQHAQHKRVIDLQGAQLNLPALFKTLYTMQRLREDIGAANTNVFEIAIPSQFYPAFNMAMLQYYKAQSNGMLELHQDVTREVKTAPLGFAYVDYKIMWPNVTIRVMTDRYFDDRLAAMTAAGLTTGRMAWILDWSKIYVGIFASERVVNTTNDLKTLAAVDPTYKCVMKIPTVTTTLMSFTYTVICEAPQANLILENFSGEVPEAVVEDGADYDTTCATTTTSTTTTTTTAEA